MAVCSCPLGSARCKVDSRGALDVLRILPLTCCGALILPFTFEQLIAYASHRGNRIRSKQVIHSRVWQKQKLEVVWRIPLCDAFHPAGEDGISPSPDRYRES